MPDDQIDKLAVYVLGRIEQWIADYARSSKVPEDVLAHRVAELLSAQARGSLLGPQNSMPLVSRNGTRRGRPSRQMALARGAHPEASVSAIERVAALARQGISNERIAAQLDISEATVRTYLSKASKQGSRGFRYRGRHWTQLPQNKKRIALHLKKIRKLRGK